jgi:hypothetical protein
MEIITNWEVLTHSTTKKPEGSSPHSQQLATGPYPEPVESNPHTPSQSHWGALQTLILGP